MLPKREAACSLSGYRPVSDSLTEDMLMVVVPVLMHVGSLDIQLRV